MPRNPGKKIKSGRLNATASEEEEQAFKDACEKVGLEHTDTLRNLAAAFVRQVKQHGSVSLPLELSSRQNGNG